MRRKRRSTKVIKYKIYAFAATLLLLTVAALIIPLRPKESEIEKRTLSKFPKPSFETLWNGEFFEGAHASRQSIHSGNVLVDSLRIEPIQAERRVFRHVYCSQLRRWIIMSLQMCRPGRARQSTTVSSEETSSLNQIFQSALLLPLVNRSQYLITYNLCKIWHKRRRRRGSCALWGEDKGADPGVYYRNYSFSSGKAGRRYRDRLQYGHQRCDKKIQEQDLRGVDAEAADTLFSKSTSLIFFSCINAKSPVG